MSDWRQRRPKVVLPVPRHRPPSIPTGKPTGRAAELGFRFRPQRPKQFVDDLAMRSSTAPKTAEDLSESQRTRLQKHFEDRAGKGREPILFADFEGTSVREVDPVLDDWTVHHTVGGYFHKLMVLYNNTDRIVTCNLSAEFRSAPEEIEGYPPLIFEPTGPISIEPGQFKPVLMKLRAGLAGQLSYYSEALLEDLLPIKKMKVVDDKIERLMEGVEGDEDDDTISKKLDKLEIKKRKIIQQMLDNAGYNEPEEEADYESDAGYRKDHWEDIHETILKPKEQYLARLEASGIFIHVGVSGGKTYKFECSPKSARRAGLSFSLRHNMR